MKRIIKTLSNRNNTNRKIKQKKISIVGVSSKIGVTHISISLCNWISSFLRERVIYISLASDHGLIEMVGEKSIKVGGLSGFLYKGVEYVISNNIDEILTVLSKEKAWIIIDIKELNETTNELFKQCTRKIVIGSMMPWCRSDYHRFIREKLYKRYDLQGINFYIKNKDKDNMKEFKQRFGCIPGVIPIINNPFCIEETAFEELLKMIM